MSKTKMREAVYSYDADYDVLSLHTKGPVYSSLELGPNIILDITKKGELVGIEFLDASQVLSEVAEKRVPKKLLKNISKAKFLVKKKRGLIAVAFVIYSTVAKPIEQSINFPAYDYESPVLAYAVPSRRRKK